MTSVYLHFINCPLTAYVCVSRHVCISLELKHWSPALQYHKESSHTAFFSMLKMKSMTSMWMILKNKLVQATAHQRNRTFVIFGCHNQSYDILVDSEMGGHYNETRPTPPRTLHSYGVWWPSNGGRELFILFRVNFFPSLAFLLPNTHSLTRGAPLSGFRFCAAHRAQS